jgi:isoleucyl-tRNA synthetase
MAPVLSFLAEEVYEHFPELEQAKKDSVFLLKFPESESLWNKPQVAEDFKELLLVREDAQKKIEKLRSEKIIGASLEVHLKIQARANTFSILKKYEAFLREFFIVSQVSLSEGDLLVEAEKAIGEKCARCWVYSTKLSQDEETQGICPKCVEALL